MTIPKLSHVHILVVEDDDLSFLYLNQLLKLTECRFTHVKSGIDALEHYTAKGSFHLVLMDIQLPDMDGKDVTRRIRMLDPDVPIIAQSAAMTYEEREQALQSGCNDVLIKPFSIDSFFGILMGCLSA
jgi:CheY-like chemotaxis protein